MIKKIEDKDLFKNCHWVRLEEICQTTSGGTPSRSIASYYDGTIPWVKSGELNDCLIYDTEEKITEQAIKNSSAKIFKPETLLIALYGATIGKLGILKISAATNQAVCAIFNTKYVDRDYLYFYLLTRRKNLIELSSGGAQPNISQEIIRRLKIPLPPLEEQKRIVAIAQKADRLRRTRRYALQLSDTFLQSVFLEMFGDPEINPKNWDIEPFEEVCAIDAEMVDPKIKQYHKYLHIGGANVESITGNFLGLKTAEEEGLISGKFLINPQHILFSKIRPKLRKVAFPRIHALCSADIYPITIKSSKCNPYFLLYYLRSDYFSKIVSELAESRTNIPKVNRDELAEQSIPLPPLPLQEKFAQIVQKFERLRTQQREAERQAEHLFQTILHRAFRGELTSSDINEEPASDLLEQNPPKQTKPETTVKAGDTSTRDTAKNPDTKAKPQDTEAIQLKLPGFE
ncbi:restriction endonuclease subunit S [Laspinema sp. D1]|uniref:Restriction endonuclease subunit S n=1 Tax=Laspinema palackyanum D2a TaxID=2953684 RepID=A0ABT2MSB5_9CYAN|nr:restriction endonuclease subunit S [Laspinema sp. D2a]